MGMFDFVKSVGKKLGIGGDDAAPSADTLKQELDSHNSAPMAYKSSFKATRRC